MKTLTRLAFIMGVGIFITTGCATPSKQPSRYPAARNEDQSQTEVPVTPIDPGNVTLNDLTYFTTPEDGHQTFINAIKSAKEKIVMEMFHLTDKEVVDTLLGLPGFVKVTLILDPKNASEGDGLTDAESLGKNSNITVIKASSKFEITHSKAMVVDPNTPTEMAYITSINLTNAAEKTRDYGISTHDHTIIESLVSLFNQDVTNANDNPQTDLPTTFTDKNIIIAPVPESAKGKLLGLILGAKNMPGSNKFVYSTVENLVDTDIMAAFESIAVAGVHVEIIVPQCDENPDSSLNYQPIIDMTTKAKSILAKMMPTEGTPEFPYMHGKMIVRSDGTVYIGSENFSFSSLMKSRETGIIFKNQNIAQELVRTFNGDWKIAVAPARCTPASTNPKPNPKPRPKRKPKSED